MPEVHALAAFLDARTAGLQIAAVTVASFAAVKTYDPPVTALIGRTIRSVTRHGKFIDITVGDPATDDGETLHLIFHLARAGWLRWSDSVPGTALKPGRSPIALRVALSDGSGFDLTEAGTKKSLAVHVVRSPDDVPGDAPLSSDHIRASWRSSSSSQPLVAASWNIAWNSVESIVGTLS